ncbi:MAG: NAD(P)-dependent oxidoreductase [Thermoplasmata archaeon]|nr:NAD(P)-dependent oxidoreductase [Thermoplasmata archaeon]
MPRRILLIGPSSGLAEEFVLRAPAGWAFEGVGRRSAAHAPDRYETVHVVDAREVGPLEYAVRANDCDTVVSFLQEGDRRLCQEERPGPGALPSGIAWDTNVLATEAIGRAAVSEHKRLIVVSTDEVFPESGGPAPESTVPIQWRENPSWYGGTWAEAEALLGRLVGSVAILRVSALFGWSVAPECDRRLAAELLTRPDGSSDILQPTFVPDAASALRRLVEDPVSGRFNVAVPEPVRRADLADSLRQRVGRLGTMPPRVSERHPGLVPGRLMELGFRPTTLAGALESLAGESEGD